MAWFSRNRTAGPGRVAGSRPVSRSSSKPLAAKEAALVIRAELAARWPNPRSFLSYEEALEVVCRATGWPVGHAWMRTPAGWRSSGAWFDSAKNSPDGAYASLRECTAVTDLGSGRGIVAAVLHLESCRFLPGLEGLGSNLRHREAAAAGLSAVIGVPVRTQGKLATVFEFITAGDVDADGTLSEALLEVAARSRRRLPARKGPGSELSNMLKSRFEAEFPQHLTV